VYIKQKVQEVSGNGLQCMKASKQIFLSDVGIIVSLFKHLREYLAYLGREFYIV